jgi:hypothetical protein
MFPSGKAAARGGCRIERIESYSNYSAAGHGSGIAPKA